MTATDFFADPLEILTGNTPLESESESQNEQYPIVSLFLKTCDSQAVT